MPLVIRYNHSIPIRAGSVWWCDGWGDENWSECRRPLAIGRGSGGSQPPVMSGAKHPRHSRGPPHGRNHAAPGSRNCACGARKSGLGARPWPACNARRDASRVCRRCRRRVWSNRRWPSCCVRRRIGPAARRRQIAWRRWALSRSADPQSGAAGRRKVTNPGARPNPTLTC